MVGGEGYLGRVLGCKMGEEGRVVVEGLKELVAIGGMD